MRSGLFALWFMLVLACGGQNIVPDVNLVLPDATMPDATKPDATKPDATKPDATKDEGTPSEIPSVELCGPNVDCSDGLNCTEDFCAMPGEVCSWELAPTYCLIGGGCRNPMELNPANPCAICNPTLDQFNWTTVGDGLSCDDGDICTVNERCQAGTCSDFDPKYCEDGVACTMDGCDPVAGCTFELKLSPCCGEGTAVCDDGNPCTTDLCDDQTLDCDFQPNQAPCDDADTCTTNDQCGPAGCAGAVVECDDENPCTLDSCVAGQGCSYSHHNGAACSDGYECTTDDVCQGGLCVGDSSTCTCVPEVGDALKVVGIQIGEGGHPGQGLDVDGDSSTCAPASDCSGGINNALGILASLANPAFVDQLTAGVGMVLLEFRGTGAPNFGSTMAILEAKLDLANVGCDFQASTCDYLVKSSNFSEATCLPINGIPASISGGELTAGAPGTAIPFSTPINSTTSIVFDIHSVLVDADVTFSGPNIISFSGLVAGAVRKDDIIAAIQAAPDGALLVDKSVVVSLITFMNADVDTDDDGLMDALSIGLIVEAIDADIAGLY